MNAIKEAKLFLKHHLRQPKEVHQLMTLADQEHIGRTTIHRAAKALGVKKTMRGSGKNRTSIWSLTGIRASDEEVREAARAILVFLSRLGPDMKTRQGVAFINNAQTLIERLRRKTV